MSDHFELSSLPGSNGVLKYLSGSPLPSHAAIICGLVKNKVICHINLLAHLDSMVDLCSGLTLINFLLIALTYMFSRFIQI
jgi:methionine S-methyltransferase